VFAAAHESGSGLTAHLSEGNTQGATTWITSVEDGARRYNVVAETAARANTLDNFKHVFDRMLEGFFVDRYSTGS
jgi:hypothetical protein